MYSIVRQSVPGDALLKTYRGGPHPERWGKYGDCFSVTIDREVSLVEFVSAFYTSPVFRIERLILRIVLGAVSTDAEAHALADGSARSFAVWRVGERAATQLLMCDRYERTRSWFRVAALGGGSTLLQFGSAVASKDHDETTSGPAPGFRFRILLGFHVLYSQILLAAAKRGVMRRPATK